MKQFYITIIALVFSTIIFAQGISVQGIARDNASSALADKILTFTFSIAKDDNTIVYSETQSIRTDNFGVFSHIVSTGNPVTSAFNNVDFSILDLKIKVSVSYSGNQIEVYNQTFQYTPYAHFAKKAALATNATNAADGAPTGSIMPYVSSSAPAGWVLCDGQLLPANAAYDKLRNMVGARVPNLLGMFLRGTGVSPVNGQSGPGLMATQGDEIKSHLHDSGTLYNATNGNHNHSSTVAEFERRGGDGGGMELRPIGQGANYTFNTSTNGNHSHLIFGHTANTGGGETRPVSYGVYYIIKL
jgi:hypothetical protein